MISINNITKEFNGEALFSNVSFNVNPKDRIGLAGKNGSGKTTLMKIIAGEIGREQGEVVIPEGLNIGYLPQEKKILSGRTVLEETLQALSFLENLQERLNAIHDEILTRDDYESAAYHKILDEQALLSEQIRLAEPEKLRGAAEKILSGLGFKHTDFERPMQEFSFGWQMRVELAKLLLIKPNLLLLDEPTNHLDIESIQWLEDFLINYSGAVMIVSHDRTLLDNLTSRTIEINNGKIYDYKASYSEYIQLTADRVEQQKAAYNNQQKQIKQIERFIERFRYKNTKASLVQSRIKHLAKMDVIEIDDLDESAIKFSFPPAPHSGKVTVEGIGITKKYGELTVLNKIDFQIVKGEKVALVGRNGEGKTTLAKIIRQELEHEGELKLGYNVITGYFAQDQWEMLDPEMTVFETVDHVAVGDIRKRLNTILGAFLFSGEDIDKKVKVLSGGEKSRLALAKLLLTPSNLLLLDEPTNHLDILSKDILKNALLQYDGTIIIVSHDRDFLQGLTSKLYEFRDKKIKEFKGDIFEFLEKKNLTELKELEKNNNKAKEEVKTESDNKLKWEMRKEFDKRIRKLESEIARVEKTIQVYEKDIAAIQQKLSNPEAFVEEIKSGVLYKQHDMANKQMEDALTIWEKLESEKDELLAQQAEL